MINITLRNLRAFVSVARFGSFTKAGEHLSISQSALTSSVQQLEAAVGVKLMDRTTRRVELTVEGQELLTAAEHILRYSEEAVSRIRDLAERRRGSVGIASVASFARNIIAPAVLTFAEKFPGISVRVRVADSETVRRLILEKEVDFGYASMTVNDPALRTAEVMEDRVGIVCPENHPLTRKKAPLSWSDSAKYDFISLANSEILAPLADAVPELADVAFSPKYEIESPEVLYSMITAGLGITTQPSSSFTDGGSGLVFLDVKDPVITRTLHFICLSERMLSTAAESMKAIIAKHVLPSLPT